MAQANSAEEQAGDPTAWISPDLNGSTRPQGLQAGYYAAPSEEDWKAAKRRDDGSLHLVKQGPNGRELHFERFTKTENEAAVHIDEMQQAFAERVHLVLNPETNPSSTAAQSDSPEETSDNHEEETVVVFGGWGESSELMEKGIGEEVRKFKPKARVIYANLNGRGTQSYADSNQASRIGLKDFLSDAEAFARRNQDLLKGKVTVVGHSMGYLAASVVAKTLSGQGKNVEKVIGLMPAVPAISPFVSWGNFVEYTKNTWEAQMDPMGLISLLTGWSYRQPEEIYNKLMLSGNKESGNAPYVLPDSIRLLMDWMMSFERIETIVQHTVPTIIVSAEKEGLLPKKMGRVEFERLKGRGVPAKHQIGWDLPHAFSVNRTIGDLREAMLKPAFINQSAGGGSIDTNELQDQAVRPRIQVSEFTAQRSNPVAK